MATTDLRLSHLTTGTICRIGIVLSSCFWVPVAVLMGFVGIVGRLPDPDLGGRARGLIGFISGFMQGIGCSVATDIAIIVGAIVFAIIRRLPGAPDLRLRTRFR